MNDPREIRPAFTRILVLIAAGAATAAALTAWILGVGPASIVLAAISALISLFAFSRMD